MAAHAMLGQSVQEPTDAWAHDAPKHDVQRQLPPRRASAAHSEPGRFGRRAGAAAVPQPLRNARTSAPPGAKGKGAGRGRPHEFRSRPAESPIRFGIAGIF